jgi:hypothetical protein
MSSFYCVIFQLLFLSTIVDPTNKLLVTPKLVALAKGQQHFTYTHYVKFEPNTFLRSHGPKVGYTCRNPSLGLATKAKACKGAGQKESSKVTSHALGSVGECEGMNPHIPK